MDWPLARWHLSSPPCSSARSTWRRCLRWCSGSWRGRRRPSTSRGPSRVDGRPAGRWTGVGEGGGTRIIYFSIILFFCCLSLQCCKEHPVLIFRFYLCLTLSWWPYNVNTLSVVLYTRSLVLKRSSFKVMIIFLWRDKNEYIYFWFSHFL